MIGERTFPQGQGARKWVEAVAGTARQRLTTPPGTAPAVTGGSARAAGGDGHERHAPGPGSTPGGLRLPAPRPPAVAAAGRRRGPGDAAEMREAPALPAGPPARLLEGGAGEPPDLHRPVRTFGLFFSFIPS